MAGFAARLRVFADQREPRHRCVVEVYRLPRLFGVTTPAILPVSTFVRIVRRVAGIAGSRRLDGFVGLLVAARASGDAMRPIQGEAGHSVMVKADLFPGP